MTQSIQRSDSNSSVITPPTRTLIDCDVHPAAENHKILAEYMPEPWKSLIALRGLGIPGPGYVNPFGVDRRDITMSNGKAASTSPEGTKAYHLDAYGIDKAILLPAGVLGVSVMPNADQSAVIASAVNAFIFERWLLPHDCFRGSILVSTRDIGQAVREVERFAGEKRFVQVVMSSAQPMPLGERYYHPLYEVCARQGLPVAIHPGIEGGGISGPPTGAGYPGSYLEWHTALATGYMAHLISLIGQGVFEKFPRLRFVLVEGGISWLVPLMWRFDKNFTALRCLAPWLKRKPSAYLHEHIRLTTQPIEEPADSRQLITLLNMMDLHKILLYASDFPHWDFDAPDAAFPQGFTQEQNEAIFHRNAQELYRL